MSGGISDVLIVMLVLYRLARVPVGYFVKRIKRNSCSALLYFSVPYAVYTGRCGRICLDIYHNKTGNMESSADDSKDSLMITGASLLSYTSTPKELADGLEKAFRDWGRLESRYMRWQ